jgi:lysophospholipase-3
MPSDKFWSANETFVFTPSKNYTIADYKQFFDDINFPTGYEYRKNTEHLTTNMIAPEVETHCLYGVGIKTPERFVFKKQKDFPDTQPAVIYGDGDGTVNLISMLGYRKWIGQSKPLYFKEIPGAEHVQILKSQAVIDYILKLFLN